MELPEEFLRGRGVTEDVIERMKQDKVSICSIQVKIDINPVNRFYCLCLLNVNS